MIFSLRQIQKFWSFKSNKIVHEYLVQHGPQGAADLPKCVFPIKSCFKIHIENVEKH